MQSRDQSTAKVNWLDTRLPDHPTHTLVLLTLVLKRTEPVNSRRISKDRSVMASVGWSPSHGLALLCVFILNRKPLKVSFAYASLLAIIVSGNRSYHKLLSSIICKDDSIAEPVCAKNDFIFCVVEMYAKSIFK